MIFLFHSWDQVQFRLRSGQPAGAIGCDLNHLFDGNDTLSLQVQTRFNGEYLTGFQGKVGQLAIPFPCGSQQWTSIVGITPDLVSQGMGEFRVSPGLDVFPRRGVYIQAVDAGFQLFKSDTIYQQVV